MGSLRAILAATALTIVPALVTAQPKPPSDAQKQQAGDLVKKAIAKSQAGDHATAIELYQQAYNIAPQPLLLSNIGAEYQQMPNKAVEALKYFCQYLEADPTGTNATYATAQAKSLQIQLGNQVDDKTVCKPITKPAIVESHPTDNGTGGGSGSGSGSASEAGAGSGSASLTGTTNLGTAPVDHDNPGHGLRFAGLVTGGVGIVVAGIGGYFAYKGYSLNSQINGHDKSTKWPSSIDGVPIADWDKVGHDDNTKAIAFSAVGGGIAAIGVVLFYLGHSKGSQETSIAPTATPTSASVSLTGRF